jgi:glutamate 5-kinase
MVQRAGATTILANGSEPDVLARLLDGERLGTRFVPASPDPGEALESRKRWILAGSHAPGCIVVDHGAAQAITQHGKSLLPIGVVQVGQEGFERGETVRIYKARAPGAQSEIARGVVRYSAAEVDQIKGLHSKQIRVRLGYDYGDEVVHHNDMVIL